MTGEPILEARNLTKYYGKARGVEDISLAVRPGEIFGLLGPNGAGKTTVIRSALGLLRPTSGEIRIFGDPVAVHSDLHHEKLGYLPADLRLWPGMTARSISDLLGKIGGGDWPAIRRRRDVLAERLGLALDRKARTLSLGNRQKVGLLLALQHDPRLAILDEPTSGLDPLVRREVYDLLREASREGATIVYSSHNLPEVEQLCARVGVIRSGRLVAVKTIEELRMEQDRVLEAVFRSGGRRPEGPPPIEGVRTERPTPELWRFRHRGSPDPLIRWLAGFDLEELNSPYVSLEESFLSYYHE